MKLKIITSFKGCSGGACPKIFLTDTDEFVIQGYKLDPETKKQIIINDNENLVRIPKELFIQMLKELENTEIA